MAEIGEGTYMAYLEARARAKDAKELADKLAAVIKEQAGADTVLTVNGRKVGSYEYVDRFPEKRFLKEHRELAEQFTTYRTEEVLNLQLLARTLPDLYREYQTRSLTIDD